MANIQGAFDIPGLGTPEDIEKWMRLVTQARWNFPGLETQEKLDGHLATVLKFMDKQQAICVKKGNEIVGVMLFSRRHNMICCLAVSPEYRRLGVASMLMEEALGKLDRTKEISVYTFRAEDEKGSAPRALYEKYGFIADALVEEMNYPNQKYVLHPPGSERKDRQLAINHMVREISGILSDCEPSIYMYGSSALNDFRLGWSDIDILVLTEKQISEAQANALVNLRQAMLEKDPGNPYYRSFEGGMLTWNAFLSKKPDRVVYWGTSTERITDSYRFDSFGMAELTESSVLLYGKDIRKELKYPAFHELYADVKRHYETIRTYAKSTGRSIYSYGWLLDIARCIYTLRTGKIIAKTEAAQWALDNTLCPDPVALAAALKVRRNPLQYKDDEETFDYAETLAGPIQRFADVLEEELENSKGHYLQYIDGIPFKLKSAFDFSFLNEYGKVFKVYDDQDSGNICFGIEKDGKRYFVKFAGAFTKRYDGDPADAVARLKATLPIYRDLKHKNLIKLIEAREIGGGFAMVFQWASGDCMGRMYPEAHSRFLKLPVGARLAVFGDILNFFEYVAARDYVAIDFYDGSILYDFENGQTTICDIDFFRRQPCINDMGRMWGSSRFQSPEEYQLGATIDEVTNVYTLGATAFALFGEYSRTRDKWQLTGSLFEVAAKAVSDDRSGRQQSITQFKEEWEAAFSRAGS